MALSETGEAVSGRLERLRRLAGEHSCPNMLLTCSENRRYFSGFKAADAQINESSGALLITAGKQYLLTDSRYVLAAGEEAPLFEVIQTQGGDLAASLAEIGDFSAGLWYEARYLTVYDLQLLKKKLKKAKLRPLPFDSRKLRISKNPAEIALIEKALAVTE
ncbi:MAG: aminopeptidase P family N-terminal domain-containing protein, partial [Deltaproteobacteria bacterium]|nr:aminopeptidase P family N-terminal domain-containing protein [Deltaproteobacteria bacterium]